MNPAISVSKLGKTFTVRRNSNLITGLFKPDRQEVHAVSSISFEIQSGEAVAFLGPNGAGKTTTTKMLTGLVYPSNGTIKVLGYTPFERDHAFLRRIGLVMGNKSGLNWDLTAEQSFWLLKNIYRIPDAEYEKRLKELSILLEVGDHFKTQLRRLSLGERMKMELIGAILHNPEILFLDEPTIGLDITTKKNIRQFLRKIQQETGVTLVLTSHDMDDIEHVCDRVIVITKGKKVYDDSLATLAGQYRKDRYVRMVFENGVEADDLGQFGEVLENNENGFLVRVPSDRLSKLLTAVTAKENLLDIHIESVPLEEMIGDIFQRSR
jgi:ABC-2 type transport system ATP-binding protein